MYSYFLGSNLLSRNHHGCNAAICCGHLSIFSTLWYACTQDTKKPMAPMPVTTINVSFNISIRHLTLWLTRPSVSLSILQPDFDLTMFLLINQWDKNFLPRYAFQVDVTLSSRNLYLFKEAMPFYCRNLFVARHGVTIACDLCPPGVREWRKWQILPVGMVFGYRHSRAICSRCFYGMRFSPYRPIP